MDMIRQHEEKVQDLEDREQYGKTKPHREKIATLKKELAEHMATKEQAAPKPTLRVSANDDGTVDIADASGSRTHAALSVEEAGRHIATLQAAGHEVKLAPSAKRVLAGGNPVGDNLHPDITRGPAHGMGPAVIGSKDLASDIHERGMSAVHDAAAKVRTPQEAKALDRALAHEAKQHEGDRRALYEEAASWFHYHANLIGTDKSAEGQATNRADQQSQERSIERLHKKVNG